MLQSRILAWSAVAVVAGLAITWALLPAPETVEIARPIRGPMEVTLAQEGRTRVAERYVVSAPVAGQARRVALHAGDEVAAGAVLVQIEPAASAALDPRTAAEARAALARAQANERAVLAERDAAVADAARAVQRADRLRAAAAGGAVTRDELDAAESTARAAAARARAAASATELARAEVEAAAARLQVTAGAVGLHGIVAVRSPIDGCVLAVMHESAGVVAAGQPLIELGCRARLEIRADVLSADALRLAAGGEARIEDWGGDRPLAARIQRIEPQAFTKVSALGVEEQRVWVVLEPAGPAAEWQQLGDDYRVMVQFLLARAPAALQVAASAVFEHEGQSAVLAVGDHGRLVLRQFTSGLRNAAVVEVTAGLTESDRLVLHPRRDLRAGQKVTPLDAP